MTRCALFPFKTQCRMIDKHFFKPVRIQGEAWRLEVAHCTAGLPESCLLPLYSVDIEGLLVGFCSKAALNKCP